MKRVADNARELRAKVAALRWSQKDLRAHLELVGCNLTAGQVSKILAGKHTPGLSVRGALAELLGHPIESWDDPGT